MNESDIDNWVSLTSHELRYLLSLGEGRANAVSRARLGIPVDDSESDVTLAGRSTLLVRGLAKMVDEGVEPVDLAAMVAWLLSTSHTWFEVGVTIGKVADALLILANDDVAAVMAPQAMGIFRAALIDAGSKPAEIAVSFAREVLEGNAEASASARAFGVNGELSAGVSRRGDTWLVVRPLPDRIAEGELVPEATESTPSQAIDALTTVFRRGE